MIFRKLLAFGLVLNFIFLLSCSGGNSIEIETEIMATTETAEMSTFPVRPERLYDLEQVYDPTNDLKFDIYHPTKILYEKSPLLVAFHGGGWVAGDRSQIMYIFSPIVEELREHGFAVATVQYRYAQDATFPAQLEDTVGAIRYMRDNAEKYNIDINSIGTMGYSAGAQLAMLAAYAVEGDFDIKYCIAFAGPSKLYGEELSDYPDGIRYLLEWLFGGEYEEKEAEYMSGSPYYYIDAGTKKVPLMLVHDKRDDVVPFSQSQLMQKKFAEANIPCELLALNGVYHQIDFTSPFMSSPSGEEATRTIVDFVRKYAGK